MVSGPKELHIGLGQKELNAPAAVAWESRVIWVVAALSSALPGVVPRVLDPELRNSEPICLPCFRGSAPGVDLISIP